MATEHLCMLRIDREILILKTQKLANEARLMHTKINTHQNDLNFITHDLWSKAKLGMPSIHLELLWILSYAISKKNKHISRINISGNYKIVIKSPEVHFGKKRQHAEVGHKNLIIFIYKNHLDIFFMNRKQFI
jgi:hypothetical protein